jgi:hypothetical protein
MWQGSTAGSVPIVFSRAYRISQNCCVSCLRHLARGASGCAAELSLLNGRADEQLQIRCQVGAPRIEAAALVVHYHLTPPR